MTDTRWRALTAIVGIYTERLEAPMVENRDHYIATLRERPADLDFPVLSIEATAQLEDPPRPRRATDGEQRTLAQLAVGLLGARSLRFDAGDEEARHSFTRRRSAPRSAWVCITPG